MTEKTISYIGQILKKEETVSREEYNNFRKHLTNKYKSDWICREMNEMEKERLFQTQERYTEALKAREDFEAHQW